MVRSSNLIISAALGATLQLSQGFRKMSTRKVRAEGLDITGAAGIPIYNFKLRDLQFGDDKEKLRAQSKDTEYDWVIMLKDSATEKQMTSICKFGDAFSEGHVGGIPYVTVKGTESELQDLLSMHHSAIDFVEADMPVFPIPELPADEQRKEMSAFSSSVVWGHNTIALDEQHFTGAGVHVYVMDTGGRSTHVEYEGRAIPTVDTIVGNGTAVECNGDVNCATDSHGHGTHVAGTVAGKTYGVAKDATIHIMKVCCGQGTSVLAGFDWVLLNHETPALISMSLGSYGVSEASRLSVDRMTAAGVSVFVSAGNNDIDSCEKTFAFIESTITVGSSDPDNMRSSFSNWGSCVDIYAPGRNVLSSGAWSDTDKRMMSGTSMATPMTAGVGALILEQFPSLSPADLKAKLLEWSTKGALTDLMEGDSNNLLRATAA